MTADEFFAELEGQKFELRDNGSIRSIEGLFCPLCFVCWCKFGIRYSNMQYARAAEKLGLTYSDANNIAFAADTPGHPWRERLVKLVC